MFTGHAVSMCAAVLLIMAGSTVNAGHDASRGRNDGPTMWYRHPARTENGQLHQGLPFGNGHMGGWVHGGIPAERVALNHTWLWRNKGWKWPETPIPEVARNLPEVQQLFFAGDLIKAGKAANQQLSFDCGTGLDSFQPFGDINILLAGDGGVSEYRRELDLSTGVVAVTYVREGIRYCREVFASRTDDVIVLRMSADKPGSVTGCVTLSRLDDPECTLTYWARDQRLGFVGKFIEQVGFAASAAVLNKGGTLSCESPAAARIQVSGADEIVVLVSLIPDRLADDPQAQTVAKLDEIGQAFDFSRSLGCHQAAHRALFARVSLMLGEDSQACIPTDERLARFAAGAADPDLIALYFQYGRYLMISGSRRPGVPLNLQGMWNESLLPPWSSDLHLDCNLQMNYWIAENTNLSECADPLFDYVESMLPQARQAAKNLYGCRGIWFPLASDAWGKVLKASSGWSEWTGAAAWLAQHFWWHWEYTGDKEFLRERVYPLYKEVGLFYEDFLVKDPRRESPHHGKLVTAPSQSPENYFVGGVTPVSLCVGATMDFQLIREVFTHLLEASEILEVDADQRDSWRYVLDNIPPLQIGKHGQLQEWLEDHEEAEVNHRHISHLYAVFPGDQITVDGEPELAQAARVAMDRRLVPRENISIWPAARAWYALVYARMREGDLAYDLLRGNLTDAEMIGENLLSTISGGRYQIDGNFAGSALIAEMLLQSHRGAIHLLPALPAAWPSGRVTGLVARGGFEVDIQWAGGELARAVIASRLGHACRVRWGEQSLTRETEPGRTYTLEKTGGVWRWQ